MLLSVAGPSGVSVSAAAAGAAVALAPSATMQSTRTRTIGTTLRVRTLRPSVARGSANVTRTRALRGSADAVALHRVPVQILRVLLQRRVGAGDLGAVLCVRRADRDVARVAAQAALELRV